MRIGYYGAVYRVIDTSAADNKIMVIFYFNIIRIFISIAVYVLNISDRNAAIAFIRGIPKVFFLRRGAKYIIERAKGVFCLFNPIGRKCLITHAFWHI